MNKSKKIKLKKLFYHITDEDDIINRFSVEGFELLSASFLSFIDLACPAGADPGPVLLEIIGAGINENEQRTIDNAIWLHYRLRMTWLARKLKLCRVKTLWFLLGTILSSVLLYMAIYQTNEVANEFFYIPMWFFGYRLLMFPLQEYIPLHREFRRCRRLAAMKLIFSGAVAAAISESIENSAYTENAVYYHQAIDGIREAALTKKFIREDGTVVLSCRADSAEDLISRASAPGSELISGELAAFLDQAEPFVNPGKPLELKICGADLSEKEKRMVSAAFTAYSGLRYEQSACELKGWYRKILGYAAGLTASSMLLYFCGYSAGLALHQFLEIALWFFADYLVEFVLLGLPDVGYTVRIRRRMKELKLRFQSEN